MDDDGDETDDTDDKEGDDDEYGTTAVDAVAVD